MFFARKKRDAALKDTIDRLGAVRDALRVLRVREEALLKELAAYRPADYVRAEEYELEKRREKRRRFDRFALPKHIMNDDAYWTDEVVEILTFVPLDPTQKRPTADQIADTYAETHDLPIGLPDEEATYGERIMPAALPARAAPLARDDGAARPETFDNLEQALAAAEAPARFDFSGVPRYRTGGKARRNG